MATIDYDQIATEYSQHRRVHPGLLRHVASDLASTSRVLEVGCGTGNYISALEAMFGCSCCGIDPSEQMLVKGREQSPRVHFQMGKAEKLDFPDESFDLVLSVDVIHHVQDRTAYLRGAYRVLRPGGRVWTATDSEEIIRQREPLAVYFPETIEVDLDRYPSMADLRQAMRDVGFQRLDEVAVAFPCQLSDISSYRAKAFSCLHLISADAHRRGIERMEQDLKMGPLQGNARYAILSAVKERRD